LVARAGSALQWLSVEHPGLKEIAVTI